MRLIPIPRDSIEQSLPVWFAFLNSIAETEGYSVEQMMGRISSGEVQPIVVWDEDAKEARAFAGLRVFDRGGDRIAEVIWLTGFGREGWTHLIDDFETYARQIGCAGARMFARRGWKPFLTGRGYRETHVILDKDWK